MYTTTSGLVHEGFPGKHINWLPVAVGLEVARAVYKQLKSFKQAQRSGYNPNRLQRDLPAYIAAASSFSIDHGDVGDFAEGILLVEKPCLRSRGLERCGFDRLRDGAKFSGSRARLSSAQNPLREQPGHCPRRLNSRIDDAPLQQHQAR